MLPLVARLAQSVEHETLNLRVVGSNPTDREIFLTCDNWQKFVELCSEGGL